MIRYSLKCDKGHGFESWFASASAYDSLARAGHLACPACGSAKVDKALMVPAVATSDTAPRPLATPESEIAAKLAELRRHVEETSDYVGEDFVSEARAIHLGEAPERAIWGEAKLEEARALAEEGVPVAPLPFMGKARVN